MNYLHLLLSILTFGLLSSCLDDKTNLMYTNVLLPDSIIVTDVKTGKNYFFDKEKLVTFKTNLNEELQLDVKTFYRGDDEITYEWKFGDNIIATGANLRHAFSEEGLMLLMVYRKNAGNAQCFQVSIQIRKPFNTGVVVLGKKNGKMRFDFIERFWESNVSVNLGGKDYKISRYDFPFYENMYGANNGGEELMMQNPLKLYRYGGYNWESEILTGIQLLDRNWQNSVTVNSETMHKIMSMKDEFITVPRDLQLKDYVQVGPLSLLLDHSGKIYTRINYDYGNPGTGKYSDIPLGYDDPNDIPDKGSVEVDADQVFNSFVVQPVSLIYEKKKNRFLAVIESISGGNDNSNIEYYNVNGLVKPEGKVPDGAVLLSNISKKLITVIMPQAYTNRAFFLFKEGSDYYLQTCEFNSQTADVPYQVTYKIVSIFKLLPEIANLLAVDGNVFTIDSKEKIYFTSANALYVMDRWGENLKKWFEFSGKAKITHVQIMKPWEETSNIANRYFNGRVFCAAFDNGDFKVVKMYDDPEYPGVPQYKFWVDEHYDGGVFDILYY